MRKCLYIFLFTLVYSFCYSQNIYRDYTGKKEECLVFFVFKNCFIDYEKPKSITLFGEQNNFENFTIISRVPIQKKKSSDKTRNKFANRKIKIGFSFKLDSGYLIYDTIFKILEKEIKDKAVLNSDNKKKQDDFESESCGLFLANENYLMYIKSKNEKNEPFYIVWYNTKIFCLEITGRRKFADGILSFMQNAIAMKANTNNNSLINGYKLVDVKSISVISQILDELKTKYTRNLKTKKI